ncbi:MFS transporter [Marinivivus vitaminiproducens]|uniref:MFS transporter n=1 Tax=Marinivivus vitaminiproducens TaxID=3035935 RepID=UPI002798DA94|nr:MFS transporter [Geminicoccaceae bacterium SCSIO 64248]
MSAAARAGSAATGRTVTIVVVAGCMIALLTFGVRAGFGLFLEPISSARGWGREVFAFAIAVQNLLWGLGQPFAGMIADRYGAARVLVAGGVVYAAGVALMAVSTTPLAMVMSAGVLIGLGLSAASFSIVLAAMGRLVGEERRSWALGIGTAAGSLGQFLLVPLGQGFITAYGWPIALYLLGLMTLLVVPLASAFRGPAPAAAAGADQSMGEALREAFGHRSYVLLFSGFFVCGFHVAFIQTHLPPYLADVGLGGGLAAWAIALVGLFNVIGSYSAGVLGNRHSKRYMLSMIYLLRAIAIALFVMVPPSQTSVLLFAAAIGILWLSTVPLTSGLVAQMFGTRYMATLFGFVFFGHQIGAFLGVWLGGALYDATGSYDVVWWLSVALGVFAALIHWPIDERPVARLAAATGA